MSRKRPNIILIMTDQHRADHLGCYGNGIVRTPNIDRLAAGGTCFDRFYVATPVCMPNRASLATGRMPSAHLARHNGVPLPTESVTFFEVLRDAGYDTALIGKSHLHNFTGRPAPKRHPRRRDLEMPPEGLSDAVRLNLIGPDYELENAQAWRDDPDRAVPLPFFGFDEVKICSLHGDQVQGHYTAWLRDRCGGDPDKLRGPDNATPSNMSAPQAWRTKMPEELYPTTYIAEESLSFLDRQAARESDNPFFLKMSFPDPHHPFTPPGKYWEMYDPADMPLPATFEDKIYDPPPPVKELRDALEDAAGSHHVTVPVNEQQAREATALTYGMITMIDDAIGRVLAKLEDLGLAEDTVIAFTSDHGEFMGDRGVVFKFGYHYRELVRVPFVWFDPKAPTAGMHSERLSGTIDIAPTILERAGINAPYGVQGLNVFDAAHTHAGMMIEDYAASYMADPDSPCHYATFITDRWRLTRYESSEWGELYDLKEDPLELNNLWEYPDSRSVRAEMHERMVRQMLRLHDRGISPTSRA